MPSLRFQRTVEAPSSAVWAVVSDHELYAEAAPNLTTVEVPEGEGPGHVRHCVDTDGNEWTETFTRWEPGRGFAVQVDVRGSEFHRPLFSRFEGEWSLEEATDGVTITITFDYDTRYGPLGRVISWYLSRRAPGLVEAIFDRWEAEIKARSGPAPTATETEATDRRTNALYP